MVKANDTAKPLVLTNKTIQAECKSRRKLEAIGEEVEEKENECGEEVTEEGLKTKCYTVRR